MQRHAWLFLLGSSLLIFLLLSLPHQMAQSNQLSDIGHSEGRESRLELTCKIVQDTWHGNPVYELENHSSETLAHISVLSFSEQHLPVLWVGPKNNQNSLELISPVSPPVNLPAHQLLWFAGPQTEHPISLRYFRIEWLKNGAMQSESVQPIH